MAVVWLALIMVVGAVLITSFIFLGLLLLEACIDVIIRVIDGFKNWK